VTTYYPFPDYEERVYPDERKETSIYVRANGEIVARKDLILQVYDKKGVSTFGMTAYWDDVRVRKYVSPEPTASVGGEQMI